VALICCCVYGIIRKLFAKRRHGEKNKNTGKLGGFGGLFGGGSKVATGPMDAIDGILGGGVANKVRERIKNFLKFFSVWCRYGESRSEYGTKRKGTGWTERRT